MCSVDCSGLWELSSQMACHAWIKSWMLPGRAVSRSPRWRWYFCNVPKPSSSTGNFVITAAWSNLCNLSHLVDLFQYILCFHQPRVSTKALCFYAVRFVFFRPFVCSSVPLVRYSLPRCLMNWLNNLDKTDRQYSLAPTDDLSRFRRSKVKLLQQAIEVKSAEQCILWITWAILMNNHCSYWVMTG